MTQSPEVAAEQAIAAGLLCSHVAPVMPRTFEAEPAVTAKPSCSRRTYFASHLNLLEATDWQTAQRKGVRK
jgi:hypothetical protein